MSRLSKRLLLAALSLMLIIPSAKAQETQMNIASASGTLSGGVYQITYMASNDSFSFSWTDVAESYRVSIDPGSTFTQTENRISLTAANYLHETYTLSVSALNGDNVVASASVRFQLSQMDTTPQEADAASTDANGMARMGGGSRGGFGSSQSVTPGKALTSGHEEGSRDDSLYNTVAIVPISSAMKTLTLDGTELDVTLDDGKSLFTAEQTEKGLCLHPVETGECWRISLAALGLLKRSGVSQLELALNGQHFQLATDWEATGRVYAQLKAQGLSSKHFILLLDEKGMRLSVDGTVYRLTDDHQLILE